MTELGKESFLKENLDNILLAKESAKIAIMMEDYELKKWCIKKSSEAKPSEDPVKLARDMYRFLKSEDNI